MSEKSDSLLAGAFASYVAEQDRKKNRKECRCDTCGMLEWGVPGQLHIFCTSDPKGTYVLEPPDANEKRLIAYREKELVRLFQLDHMLVCKALYDAWHDESNIAHCYMTQEEYETVRGPDWRQYMAPPPRPVLRPDAKYPCPKCARETKDHVDGARICSGCRYVVSAEDANKLYGIEGAM